MNLSNMNDYNSKIILKLIRIMKLTLFLSLLFTLNISATVYSQNTKMSLN
jgi:hypothetical protein